MQRFTMLRAWRESHKLALEVYRMTRSFPIEERFGITSQLRRAAVSSASNIAEGSRRKSQKEFARFLNVAEASLAEVEYMLMLGKDLGYLTEPVAFELTATVTRASKMIWTLRTKTEREMKTPD